MAYNRNCSEVKAEVTRYTCYDVSSGVFLQPTVENLMGYGVVVATCCMAAKLYNLGVPRGMFFLLDCRGRFSVI